MKILRPILLLALGAFTSLVSAAPSTLTGQAAVKLPSIQNQRQTHPSTNVNVAPVWVSPPASASLQESSAGSLNLTSYVLDNNGDTTTISVQAGADVATALGLTLTTGSVTWTNAVAGSGPITFRVCDPASLCADTTITFTVVALPTPDLLADAITFVTTNGATLGAAQVSATKVISGINGASPVVVTCTIGATGCGWKKNGGSCSTTLTGTVLNGDSINACHNASSINSTSVQTTFNIGGVDNGVYTSITVASPPRVGVIFTFSAQTYPAAFNPPQLAASLLDDPVDGVRIQHVAQTSPVNYGNSAASRALPHFEVLTGESNGFRGLDSDGHWMRGTIYQCSSNSPVVDYSILNGGPGGQANDDKPRINLQAATALEAIHLHYATAYRWGAAYGLDVNYIADTTASREFIFQLTGQHHSGQTSGGGKNNLELSISGGTSTSCAGCIGAELFVERYLNGASIAKSRLPILSSWRGMWIYNYFLTDMDNCPVTGSLAGAANTHCGGVHGTPQFKWIVEIINPTTKTRVATYTVVNDTTTAWGLDDTQDTTGPSGQWNLLYKPAWCGQSAPGSYSGSKHLPIPSMLDAVRLGAGAAGYSDVHPLQLSEP